MGLIQGRSHAPFSLPITSQRKNKQVLTIPWVEAQPILPSILTPVPVTFGRDLVKFQQGATETNHTLTNDNLTSAISPKWRGVPGMFQNPQAIPDNMHAAAQEFMDWLAIAENLQNYGDAKTERILADVVKKVAVQQFADYLSQNEPEEYAKLQKQFPFLPVDGIPAYSDGPNKLIKQMLEFVETLNSLRAVRGFVERSASPDNPYNLPKNLQKDLERQRELVQNVLLNRLEADVLHSMALHLQFKAEYQDYFRQKAEKLGTLPPPYDFGEPMTRIRTNPEMAKFEEFRRSPRERKIEDLDALLVNALENLREMRQQSLAGTLKKTQEIPLHVLQNFPTRPGDEDQGDHQMNLGDAIPEIAKILTRGVTEPQKVRDEPEKGSIGQSCNPYWSADPAGEALIRKNTESLTVSAENPTGRPGMGSLEEPERGTQAYDLGRGWKVRPSITIPPGEKVILGEVDGSGLIKHLWFTFTESENFAKLGIIRGYFDGNKVPSFRLPIGSFFNTDWGRFAQISSASHAVNPRLGLESYHIMPFRKGFKFELENNTLSPVTVYYAMDFERVSEVPAEAGYFNAQYNLSTPASKEGVHTVLDVKGQGHGHLKGVTCSWRANEAGWWGEGLMLAYPGRRDYPIRLKLHANDNNAGSAFHANDNSVKRALAAVNGGAVTNAWSGTEDVYGGAWDFTDPITDKHRDYSNPYTGFVQYPALNYRDPSRRFGMYRWFKPPLHFDDSGLLVLNQILGFRRNGQLTKRDDSVATTAFYYTEELPKHDPTLPSLRELEQH